MPTHPPLNELSGELQTSESWARQETLEMLRETFARSMSSLSHEQQRDYVKLQREAHKALLAVDAQNAKLISEFKTSGLAQLRSRIGGQDPEKAYLHTRYLEELQAPLPWEPRTSAMNDGRGARRFRRAYDTWKYRAHHSSLSLWDAACLNFDFTTSHSPKAGQTFVDASSLSGVDDPDLTVEKFIQISRDLDLGGQLQTTLNNALRKGGKLQTLLLASARASLSFETLEAYRNRASTGVTRELYDKLSQAIDGSGPALEFETFSVRTGKTIALPLLMIRVASLGVVSYFPFRPDGALRYHVDANSANQTFVQQLKDSHRKGDLGWFARQLPTPELRGFQKLLKDEPRPPGLNPLAGFLYDTFHRLFPERTLDSLRFSADPRQNRKHTLVEALTQRQVKRYRANLSTLATARSERDLQAVIDGAAAIADEILQLLLTPVPGGVSGLNRVMQAVVFGSLGYSLITGINEAAKGEASQFAAALSDVADLAVNGLLITTAGRVHRQRLEQLIQRLGQPRKVMRSDSTYELWTPDIRPYAVPDQNLLDGQRISPQGTYTIKGQQYAWLEQNGQRQVVEVDYDARAMRWKIKHGDGNAYAPTIVFEPAQQVWVLDLQDAHTLSDRQLTERMLPNGTHALTDADMHTLLRSTATTRAILDRVWSGSPAPITLTEGVRRLQADQLINQLINHFHRRGHWPPHADSLVLSLLTQLPDWPAQVLIDVYDPYGTPLESYAKSDPPPATPQRITLTRRDDGTYSAMGDTGSGAVTQEPLFELILRAQPAASVLGKEGSPNLTEAQRIARIRLQISGLARARRIDLFSALTRYSGFARHEIAATDTARVFVPVRAARPRVEVTPVLKKLRDLYPPLSSANLDQLLRDQRFSSTERAQFLQDGTLPHVLREHLENHRTALRIDAVIDGLYHARAFDADTDLWAREFASSLIRNTLKRHFVITEIDDKPYANSGPDDTTVELRHYGDGHYQAYDMRNAGLIPVSPSVDSFYLAIGSVLQPHERLKLGMTSDTDAQGLRNTLGDLMSAQRSPEGYITLLDQSLGQYAQSVVLPANLLPDALGLYELDGQQLLPLYGSLYPVTYDHNRLKWRLKHPKKVRVDTPRLEHNRRGAWRLSSENPLSWDDHHLFYRLGSEDFNVDQATAQHILKLTDTPSRALREVHSAGLAPPPLLTDTSKRFRIEREILHFIRAMTTYTANRSARASLQLLLVSALPGWPRSHALEVVDSHGKVLGQYPSQLNPDAEKIRISEADSHGPEPLKNIVLNTALIEALLGELPATQQERLFKLAKKIAEHAHQERAQLFDILYRQSEQGGTRLEKRLQNHHPALPISAAKAILEHASRQELKQLHDHDEVGMRLAEQARLTAHDVRLNRAFEGLYLTTLANPDSAKIILHLLKSVPGWPAALRLDIHAGTPKGRLLEHAGILDGNDRRVLVKMDNGYRAYDGMGQALGETTDLLGGVADLLSETERQALGIDDSGDLTPLRHRLADLALGQRVAIKALLDLPHIPYWLQPPMAVNSSFTAYPFTLSDLWPFHARQPVDLVSKVREIYPSFSVAKANALIDALGMSEPAALLELERRKAEYQALDYGLTRWAESPHANDDPATDPLGMNLGQRRYLAEQIRSAWRQETRVLYADGLLDVHVLKLQLGDNDLPDADFLLGTQGFAHIDYLHIAGDTFPATGNAFLSKFANLKYLKIDCMLTELPASITAMTQLEQLFLPDNDIVLTDESRQRLGTLTRLEELHLDNNPLGLPPDISSMPRLTVLSLRNTGLTQWPIGAETRDDLGALMLQENRITTLPDALFNTSMARTNRNTVLHDNPLDADTLERINDYYAQTGVRLGGPLPGIQHQQNVPADLNDWLTGIPAAEHAACQKLWSLLKSNEDASPDDAFRVLKDLTKSYAYVKNETSKKALTQRVWHLLNAMGDSTELRNDVFLNTYLAGTCGDGAILAFIDMEIRHLRYVAKAQSNIAMAERELLALAQSLFYLRTLDQFAEDHLKSLREAQVEPDDAEVKLYLRMSLAKEFNLPVHQEELLYSAREWVKSRDIANARQKLRDISKTDAPQTSLLQEDFWLEYLARSYPEPFSTIDTITRHQVNALNQAVTDKRSDTYLDRRQSITDQETAERERLIRQLTQAAQLANQRRS
ncbi:NEL-type E3 ubiquitin ligase domain-containing protein [Pseudomonas palleroniana]|uniref:NEL-type E3 ubiquitin ligase domain-containing protein n=1 Tax=Pseudomonas palleroniana TaxID=191390 RepID=UPI0018E6C321|nr:NEL-type E3 ubiquitin ligase domain-containing protein [Pseudomonas palleroniana]MBI6906741.1 hypothetical protein [Pseudomonas palleroniana]